MAVRAAKVLAIALALAAFTPATALADGDPASDVLLGENVFYPYSPTVSPALQKTLDGEAAAAHKAHFPIKIALIASPVDLGVIPDLFGKPQQYAQFLDQEISFQAKQPLLVVMPAGYGAEGVSTAVKSALATLVKPGGTHTDDLAKAAITALPKLARATGHPIPATPGNGSKGGDSATLIVLLALAAVVTAGALAAVSVRRRRTAT
jgi:hypothetical protein